MAPTLNSIDPATREVFASEERVPVNVRALERELLALWKSASGPVAPRPLDTEPRRAEPPVTRAALLSLLVVAESPAEAREASALVARVTGHAPCRALVVELAADGEPLAAWVRAHCRRLAGRRQVCGEEITLRAAPAGDPLLAALVAPLLIPDLPVFLYWPRAAAFLEPLPGRPVARGAELLCDLDPFVDYWVLDSALAADPVALQARLLALARRRPGTGMTPRDLNWARLLAWREALAEAVDDGRFDPAAVVGIEIAAHGGCGGLCPARPALLAGWLIDRLGWRAPVVSAGENRVDIAAAGGRSIAIRLAEAPAGCAVDRPGRLERVTLHEAGRSFILERDAVPRADDSEPALLASEIDRRGVDPAYRRALDVAVTLLREVS